MKPIREWSLWRFTLTILLLSGVIGGLVLLMALILGSAALLTWKGVQRWNVQYMVLGAATLLWGLLNIWLLVTQRATVIRLILLGFGVSGLVGSCFHAAPWWGLLLELASVGLALSGWRWSGDVPWLHVGHHALEMYRPGITVYRYRGGGSRTTHWRTVLFIWSRRVAFKVRAGLIREEWTPYTADYFHGGAWFYDVGLWPEDHRWMWPAKYTVDGGVFWARNGPIEWDFAPPGVLRGESDVTRLGRWVDDFERWRAGR